MIDHEHEKSFQEYITELDSIIKAMSDAEERIYNEMDNMYGHGRYMECMDHGLSRNATRMLDIFEKHRLSPFLLHWLAEKLLSQGSTIAMNLILQTLDNILYGTPPTVTPDDMAKDRIDVLSEYHRDWPRLLCDTYQKKLHELVFSSDRGEWGNHFLMDLQTRLKEVDKNNTA